MSYVNKNLLNNEKIIYRGTIHWMIYLNCIKIIPFSLLFFTFFAFSQTSMNIEQYTNFSNFLTYTFIPIITSVVITEKMPEDSLVYLSISAVFLFFTFLSLINSYITKKSTELVITNKRIIAKFGFIRRRTSEPMHNQIAGILVSQSILERLLGCGSILIQGTGGTSTPIPRISKPLQFRKQALEIIQNIEETSKMTTDSLQNKFNGFGKEKDRHYYYQELENDHKLFFNKGWLKEAMICTLTKHAEWIVNENNLDKIINNNIFTVEDYLDFISMNNKNISEELRKLEHIESKY